MTDGTTAGPAEADPVACGAGASPRTGRPTPRELVAWQAFLRAHARVVRELESELVADRNLSLASYDVLVQLCGAPGGRLRMTELADAVLLSRSGVTRLVDRLERAGLVARCPVASDGRGVAAEVTDSGRARLGEAAPTHLAGVVRHFAARLDEDDLAALERIGRRLADG